MGVAFLPFPTALLSVYVQRGGADSHLAAAAYSATMAGIGVIFLLLWRHLARTPAVLADGFGPEQARAALRRTLPGPLVYGASIALAFLNALACLVVYAALAVYFIVPGREAREAQAGPGAP